MNKKLKFLSFLKKNLEENSGNEKKETQNEN